MIQPEADQLELALRLAKELHECLAVLSASPNLTVESRRAIASEYWDMAALLDPTWGNWCLPAILERAREQSSGQV